MNFFLANSTSVNNDVMLGAIKIPGEVIDFLIKKGFSILIIIFLMFISIKIGTRLINKFEKRQIENQNSRLALSPQKARTMSAVMHSILKYSVYLVGIATILSNIFTGMSLTFASMGGFAVGFGAQSLVKDLINGFFILFEDQYGVGDYVTIGTFSGIIDSIGIRTTILKDLNGDLHLIPNGSVTAVTNHSRNNIRFMVDVSIAYEEDIDHAIEVIDKACKNFQEEHKEDVPQPIEIWGVTRLGGSRVNIRVVGFSVPMKQWAMERALRKDIKETLDREGIEIPYNKTEMIMKEA